MIINCNCLNCTDRCMNCHSTCASYKTYVQEISNFKEVRRKYLDSHYQPSTLTRRFKRDRRKVRLEDRNGGCSSRY